MSLLRPFKKGSSKSSRNAQRARLQVESLETRCLLTSGLNANQAYIQAVYQDDLARSATQADLNYWEPLLIQHGPATVAAQIEHSSEADTKLVKNMMVNFLGRAATPTELAQAVAALQAGAAEEDVARQILGSQEFFVRSATIVNTSTSAGTTTVTPSASTVIQGMFQVLLGRPATPGEELIYMNVVGLLQNQQTAVAAQILGSEAYRQQAVKDFYGHDSQPGVLHRTTAPTGTEVDFWAHSSLDLASIHLAMEASAEKFNLGQATPVDHHVFIQSVYQDVLGRDATANEQPYWEGVFLQVGTQGVVDDVMQSDEAHTHLVQGWYTTFLGRAART